jgi:hypothetical protein
MPKSVVANQIGKDLVLQVGCSSSRAAGRLSHAHCYSICHGGSGDSGCPIPRETIRRFFNCASSWSSMFFNRQGLIVPIHQNSEDIEDVYVGLFIVCMVINLLHVHLLYRGLELWGHWIWWFNVLKHGDPVNQKCATPNLKFQANA